MQNPTDFSKYSTDSRRWAEYFLQKHKNVFRWTDIEDVFEIGCADGSITKEVVYPFVEKHLNSLLAVDLSAEAIDTANSANKNSKITFKAMDIGDEKVGDMYKGKFKKIFTFSSLHLVPVEAWSRNISKMLKKGGQVFGTMLQSPNILTHTLAEQVGDTDAPWNEYIQNRPFGVTFFGPKPIETISKILIDVGLVIDAIAIEEVRYTFPDEEYARKTMLSVSALAQYVPEKLKESYTEDYERRMYRRLKRDEDGNYYYTIKVVSFVATK